MYCVAAFNWPKVQIRSTTSPILYCKAAFAIGWCGWYYYKIPIRIKFVNFSCHFFVCNTYTSSSATATISPNPTDAVLSTDSASHLPHTNASIDVDKSTDFRVTIFIFTARELQVFVTTTEIRLAQWENGFLLLLGNLLPFVYKTKQPNIYECSVNSVRICVVLISLPRISIRISQ